MAEMKTKANEDDVTGFLESIEDEQQKADSYVLVDMMKKATGAEPVIYGATIVGFGSSTIEYANGKTQEFFSVGFSPRKGKMSLYVVDDAEANADTLARLGKHKTGKACIWVKRLADTDLDVLRELIETSVRKDAGV